MGGETKVLFVTEPGSGNAPGNWTDEELTDLLKGEFTLDGGLETLPEADPEMLRQYRSDF